VGVHRVVALSVRGPRSLRLLLIDLPSSSANAGPRVPSGGVTLRRRYTYRPSVIYLIANKLLSLCFSLSSTTLLLLLSVSLQNIAILEVVSAMDRVLHIPGHLRTLETLNRSTAPAKKRQAEDDKLHTMTHDDDKRRGKSWPGLAHGVSFLTHTHTLSLSLSLSLTHTHTHTHTHNVARHGGEMAGGISAKGLGDSGRHVSAGACVSCVSCGYQVSFDTTRSLSHATRQHTLGISVRMSQQERMRTCSAKKIPAITS
jgi:hypothetical protein